MNVAAVGCHLCVLLAEERRLRVVTKSLAVFCRMHQAVVSNIHDEAELLVRPIKPVRDNPMTITSRRKMDEKIEYN